MIVSDFCYALKCVHVTLGSRLDWDRGHHGHNVVASGSHCDQATVAGPRVGQACAALRLGHAWPNPASSGLVTRPRSARVNASHRVVCRVIAELWLSPPCCHGAHPTFHPTYHIESLDMCRCRHAWVDDPVTVVMRCFPTSLASRRR